MNLTFIRNLTTSGGDNTEAYITIDADFKLVVIATTKSDGNSGTWSESDMKITSGTGTKVRAVIYRGNAGSTGACAVFENVKNGAKIFCGRSKYGGISAVAMCFN